MVKYKYFSLVNNSFKKMNKHTKIEKKKIMKKQFTLHDQILT